MKTIRMSSLMVLALLAVLFTAPATRAQDAAITLKLGTLAPEHTTFDNILQDMGAQWRKSGVML